MKGVKVFLSGDVPRLLRKSADRGVCLYGVRETDGGAEFRCARKDVFTLMRARRSCGCTLYFQKERGLFHFAGKILKKRPVLPSIFILLLSALFISGAFYQSVEVDGCVKTDEKSFREALSDAGVRPGAPIKSVRVQKVRAAVMPLFPTVAYFTLNAEGTRARVTVYERREAPPPERDAPCDVISGLTGVVCAVRVKRGEAQVSVGQTVERGDIIATGRVVYKTGETELLPASAEIDVRTWSVLRGLLPAEYTSFERTGRSRCAYSLILFGKRISLFPIESCVYKWYHKKEEVYALTLGKNAALPVSLSKETYFETAPRKKRVSKDAAKEILKASLSARSYAAAPDAETLNTGFYVLSRRGVYEGVFTAERLETTGIQTEMKEIGTDNKR
ncbi:MAG: sporulation protein YqfD [Clostridia bacterium]|nr:sporulation protein YqfD [Clostridia bacterium]